MPVLNSDVNYQEHFMRNKEFQPQFGRTSKDSAKLLEYFFFLNIEICFKNVLASIALQYTILIVPISKDVLKIQQFS